MNQKLDALLRRDRLEFGRDHRGIGNSGAERAEAVGIAAHDGKLHVAIGETVLRQHRARKQIRQRAGARNRKCFSFEIGNRCDVAMDKNGVGKHRPVAADDLDVGPARGGDQWRAGIALIGFELAGQHAAQRQRVAFELDHIEVQSFPFGEAAFACHENKAGVAFCFDDAVTPGFQIGLRVLRRRRTRKNRGERGRETH